MNKINFLVVLMLFVSVGVFAQEEEAVEATTTNTRRASRSLYSKKGDYVLPQAGDFSIGINAVPVLNYMGDIFGKQSTNKPALDQANIYGRYWLKDDFALRVNLLADKTKEVNRYYVQDDKLVATNPTSQAQLTDVERIRKAEYYITVGAQKYRGYGRLRGFAGAVAGYGLEVSKTDYEYGNNFTEINQTPTTFNGSSNSRKLQTRDGNVNHFILGGVLGVEYYLAPKICIGIEGYLTADFMFKGQKTSQSETWKSGKGVITEDKAESPKSRKSTFKTNFGDFKSSTGKSANSDNNFMPAASIYLMFSF